MAINFIKNIALNIKDNATHHSFVRYGPGEFTKDPLIIKVEKDSIKITGGFEYTNVFIRFLSSLATGNLEVNGAIPTSKDIADKLTAVGLKFDEKNRFGKKGVLYQVQGTLTKDQAVKLFNELYNCYLLLDVKAGNNEVKIKKKETPKIGKEPAGFSKLIVAKEHLPQVIDEFLWDANVKTFALAEIKHVYFIEDIKADPKILASDPAKGREEAIRIGKVTRNILIDGKLQNKEYPLAV